MTWTVETRTRVLAGSLASLSARTRVLVQSSVAGMLSVPPEVTRQSVPVLMDSLETPTMRKLDVRRNSVWSMEIVVETLSVINSFVNLRKYQVGSQFILQFENYILD